jgi:hypothetical protein
MKPQGSTPLAVNILTRVTRTKLRSKALFCSWILMASALILNSCSVLVGQIKPVEEKAPPTPMVGVEELDPTWKRLQLETSSPEAGDIPDASWQSKKTASVIAINSACRQNVDDEGDLKTITDNLLSSWRSLKIENQQEVILSGQTGLETTAQGFYLNRTRKFQIVVVKTSRCVYDLLYLAPPISFKEELSLFQKFRDNLNLK